MFGGLRVRRVPSGSSSWLQPLFRYAAAILVRKFLGWFGGRRLNPFFRSPRGAKPRGCPGRSWSRPTSRENGVAHHDVRSWPGLVQECLGCVRRV